MTRHLLLLVLFSFIAVMWATHISIVVSGLNALYAHIADVLSIDVGGYTLGKTPRSVIALILVPFVFAAFIRLVFWLMRKEAAGIVPVVLWGVWLVLTTLIMAKAIG